MGEKLRMHAYQARAPIDIQGHSDGDFPFGSWKIGNKMSVDFGWNADDKIGMNPLITIRSPCPHTTRTRKGSFGIFDSTIGTPDLSYRGLLWNGAVKTGSEKFGGNKFFNILSAKMISKSKKLGAKFCNLESRRFRLDSC